MNESKTTPQWLIDTQNKSWEPEILISGIMLTFLFILSKYVYNLHAMLIQDYGVFEKMVSILFTANTVILTGFKIILIIHLVLRGIWTGYVGLSYVFPDGVKRENLPKSRKDIIYPGPETLVIKTEKVCSLLFSFIFLSMAFVLAFFILYTPIILLFILDLDPSLLRYIFMVFIAVVIVAVSILTILIEKSPRFSEWKQKSETAFISHALTIYYTNIGRIKTTVMFLIYFMIVISLSRPEIDRFNFNNREGTDIIREAGIVLINQDLYVDQRDMELRIPKATIQRFYVSDNKLGLFVSFYKEDSYTLKQLEIRRELMKKLEIKADTTGIPLYRIYSISVGDSILPELKWYSTKNSQTGQKGITTAIEIGSLDIGYHELKIDKLYWEITGDSLVHIDKWIVIPFEKNDITNRK
ncbi:hypothetical protein ACFL6G_04890 [candidate division KSB1 bacterium]